MFRKSSSKILNYRYEQASVNLPSYSLQIPSCKKELQSLWLRHSAAQCPSDFANIVWSKETFSWSVYRFVDLKKPLLIPMALDLFSTRKVLEVPKTTLKTRKRTVITVSVQKHAFGDLMMIIECSQFQNRTSKEDNKISQSRHLIIT